jgi:hypothetical protein
MMEQLHEQQPTLSDLVKQQLALEEAIRRVLRGATRRRTKEH